MVTKKTLKGLRSELSGIARGLCSTEALRLPAPAWSLACLSVLVLNSWRHLIKNNPLFFAGQHFKKRFL